jgi:integrase
MQFQLASSRSPDPTASPRTAVYYHRANGPAKGGDDDMGLNKSDLQATLEGLLELVKSKEDGPKGPTLKELWGHDDRPGFTELVPGYWQGECSKLTSANRSHLAWRNMSGLEVRGMKVGETPALSVTSDWVEDLRTRMHDRITYRKKPPRNGTINRELEVLARMLHWAHEQNRLPYNPLPALTKEDERDGIPKTKIRYEEQLAKLLEGCGDNKMLATIVLVLYDSGMRRSECLNMRRDQVVRKDSGGGWVELGIIDTKTGVARRPRLTKRAIDALESLPNYGPYYFCKPDGDRYNPRYIYEMYVEAVARSGLKGVNGETITMHTLRHSMMYTWRSRYRVPWVVIKKQGGWKTDSTPQRYGATDDDEMDGIMDNVVEVKLAAEAERIGPRRSPNSETPAPELSSGSQQKIP